jgi:hypothetical protein
MWVKFIEGGAPAFFETVFQGTLDEAAAYLQAQADRQEVSFGQVLDEGGRIFSNIAPRIIQTT